VCQGLTQFFQDIPQGLLPGGNRHSTVPKLDYMVGTKGPEYISYKTFLVGNNHDRGQWQVAAFALFGYQPQFLPDHTPHTRFPVERQVLHIHQSLDPFSAD
jgi:hypothetical protein